MNVDIWTLMVSYLNTTKFLLIQLEQSPLNVLYKKEYGESEGC